MPTNPNPAGRSDTWRRSQQVKGCKRKSDECAGGAGDELLVPVNKMLRMRGQFCLSLRYRVQAVAVAHWTAA
jgi:hypothetical protein